MDLNFSESQEILRKSARDFLEAECPPSLVKEMESDPRGYPDKLWKGLADMGWPGILVPEAYGGHGGSLLDLIVVMEEAGRAALPGPFFSTAVLGGLAILEGASEAQKRSLLPRLARGELVVTLALSEPGIDFGVDGLATRAVERNGGYVLSGTKIFVPDAHVAGQLLCVAAGEAEIRVLLVDPKARGVSIAPLATNLHDKQFEVAFDNVRVAKESLLGSGDARGWLERALAKAMVARCAEMVGAGRKLLEMTVQYAKDRVQFEKPIGALQAVQHHCANLATCIETAELMTWHAGWLIEQGKACRREALRAKAWANEACKRAAALGHQVHGGMGFTREYDLYLYSARMTTFAQLLGGTAWCYDRLADEIGLKAV